MEDICRIARAHYDAAPPRVQSLARNFFRQLDYDGNGWVSRQEFVSFMRQPGIDQRLSSPGFFRLLDRDGNGILGFWEVMTLYYIIKSHRPFCDRCNTFIMDTYYSCVACFDSPRGPFNLCHNCYRSCQCHHNHNGRVQFLDNYTLLNVRRTSSSQSRGTNSTQKSSLVNRSNAIIPAQRRSSWNDAVITLEVGLRIGNIETRPCSIL